MGEKHKEINKKMKRESEQRQQWWTRTNLKEKMNQKETEQKQKMKFFVWLFGVLKAKRQEIKNNNFKNNGKQNGFLTHKCF